MKIFLVAIILCVLPGCAKQDSLLVVDTVSGANFQWFFKRKVIPGAEDRLTADIDYILSSGPEMVERMKAWGEDSPEVDVILVKPRDLSAMMDAEIPLMEVGPDRIPAASRIPGLEGEFVLGRELRYRAVPLWRSQTGLIYNSRYVSEPPGSWKELRERADSWHGRIGVIRPDAKSSGGRRFIYGFLAAMGVDMSIPLGVLEETPMWKKAWEELEKFSRHVRMPMGEAPFLFQQFKKEQVWLSVYSMDYALWARDQGFLPGDLEVSFLEEGMPSGADAYIAIPTGLPIEREIVAVSFVNYLLSDDLQLLLLQEMNQYPSVSFPAGVPESLPIPPWPEVKERRIELTAREVIEYIRERATSIMTGSHVGVEQ
jgi:ABC-type uncharacterized transport system YnjBCD substrate-binding protein